MVHQAVVTNTIQKHGKSAGLCVLKPQPRVVLPLSDKPLNVNPVPYERILKLVNVHLQRLTQNQLLASQYKLATPITQGCIAWVSHRRPHFDVYPPALEARGALLKHFMFFETQHVEKTLNAILSQRIFKAVVVVAPESRAVLQMARRWLKPRDNPAVCRVPELKMCEDNKLFVYSPHDFNGTAYC